MTFKELMDAFYVNKHYNNNSIYAELLAQLKRDRITPVIGAGLSVWAGYPLWSSLIEDLSEGMPDEDVIKNYLSKAQYEKAASVLEESYGHDILIDMLIEQFSDRKLNEGIRPEYQKLLPELFKGPFVTTNFDISLEKLLDAPFTINPQDTFHEEITLKKLQAYEHFLIKLHGTIEDPKHMVFTEESYNSAYGNGAENSDCDKPLPQQLKLIFQTAPPLFLGCSLSTDRTCKVFEKCNGAKGFALIELPKETVNPENPLKPYIKDENQKFKKSFDERRKILSGMGIRVIWYPYGEHSAVEILIKQLAEDIKNENKKKIFQMS